MLTSYDFTGLAGVALSVYGYARVQWQREFAKRLTYSVLNLLAAVMVGVSLLNSWSLAAFVSCVASAFLSVYGIHRCMKYKRKSSPRSKKDVSSRRARKILRDNAS